MQPTGRHADAGGMSNQDVILLLGRISAEEVLEVHSILYVSSFHYTCRDLDSVCHGLER